MFPLVLALRVCLVTDPGVCHDAQPIPLIEGTSIMACAMAGQIEGARWVEAHPSYFIARAQCRPASRMARI